MAAPDERSPNTSSMERVALEADHAARTGMQSFAPSPRASPTPAPSAPRPSAGNDLDDDFGLQVYNPVEDSYASWGENGEEEEGVESDCSGVIENGAHSPGGVDPYLNHDEDEIDLTDPELVASQREQLAELEAAKDQPAFTMSDMHEEGPDFYEDYMAGRYDKTCPGCNGSGKILVVDSEKCNGNIHYKQYCADLAENAYFDAMRAAERRMGA